MSFEITTHFAHVHPRPLERFVRRQAIGMTDTGVLVIVGCLDAWTWARGQQVEADGTGAVDERGMRRVVVVKAAPHGGSMGARPSAHGMSPIRDGLGMERTGRHRREHESPRKTTHGARRRRTPKFTGAPRC